MSDPDRWIEDGYARAKVERSKIYDAATSLGPGNGQKPVRLWIDYSNHQFVAAPAREGLWGPGTWKLLLSRIVAKGPSRWVSRDRKITVDQTVYKLPHRYFASELLNEIHQAQEVVRVLDLTIKNECTSDAIEKTLGTSTHETARVLAELDARGHIELLSDGRWTSAGPYRRFRTPSPAEAAPTPSPAEVQAQKERAEEHGQSQQREVTAALERLGPLDDALAERSDSAKFMLIKVGSQVAGVIGVPSAAKYPELSGLNRYDLGCLIIADQEGLLESDARTAALREWMGIKPPPPDKT